MQILFPGDELNASILPEGCSGQEKARGLILLLDERFSTRKVSGIFSQRKGVMPRHCTAESLTSYLQKFWEC